MTNDKAASPHTVERLSSGIDGLDTILNGGYLSQRAYLIRGKVGTGKTSVGMHFLSASDVSETFGHSLCITFGERPELLDYNAQIMGIPTDNIAYLDLSPNSQFFTEYQSYSVFHSHEIETAPVTQSIIAALEEHQPERVFIDAMTQLHYLTSDKFQAHSFILSLIRYLTSRDITLLYTSSQEDEEPDIQLQSIADGIVQLEFERKVRYVSIKKMRGSTFLGDRHTMRFTDTGVEMYPRLLEDDIIPQPFQIETMSSGIPELDELLGGGVDRGTVTIITGPTGIGKTTLGLQFMKEAGGRGERSVLYCFEEDRRTLIKRGEGLNMPLKDMLDNGSLNIVQIRPLQMTADEFAAHIRQEVEEKQVSIVMIDSVAGYKLSLPGNNLLEYLHVLSKYLRSNGVTLIIVNETHRLSEAFRVTESGISYLMDTVIFMRYFERDGRLHHAIGALKKRVGSFEKVMRELRFGDYGLSVGKRLRSLVGLLGDLVDKADLVDEDD